jgi:hypothetical protein
MHLFLYKLDYVTFEFGKSAISQHEFHFLYTTYRFKQKIIITLTNYN